MPNNRSRGAAAERELAKLIGGTKVSRTGHPGPDVLAPDGTLIEVKRVKALSALLRDWIEQMEREGAQAIAFRADRGKWYMIQEVKRVYP